MTNQQFSVIFLLLLASTPPTLFSVFCTICALILLIHERFSR